MFTGQRGQVCIGHKVCDGLALDQHFLKDDPVPVGRMNNARAGLIQPALHTGERLIERQRVLKDARIRPYRTRPHKMGLKAGRNLDNIQVLLSQIEGEDHR